MIEIILSISDINHALERVLELMLMFFAPIIALVMIYVFAIRPFLRALHRVNMKELERRCEHQQLLNYKYNDQYNAQSTKAGLEKEIKKGV